jgi:hypothetical protein
VPGTAWQHRLRLDSAFELFVQSLDRIRGPHAAPLAWRRPGEGEQAFAGFLETVGNGAMLEAPLADEGLAPDLHLLARGRMDYVVAIGGDLLMQALGPSQRCNVARVIDKAEWSGLVVREDSCGKRSAHYGSRIKIEPMAPEVRLSGSGRRVTVHDEPPGIDRVREGEKWLSYPCQHLGRLLI